MSTPLSLRWRSLAGPESLAYVRTRRFPLMGDQGRFGRVVRRRTSLPRRGHRTDPRRGRRTDNRPAAQPQEGNLGRPAWLETPAPLPLVSQSSNAALLPVTTWLPPPIVHVSPSSLRSVTEGASFLAVIRLTLLATARLTNPGSASAKVYPASRST